ncbi:MAG: transposase [Desulfobacteraceae bacterium]|nr:transposase [Desulfobacteraceae bacterium]
MNAKKFISELPKEEISPTVIKLIDFIQQQSEELQVLRDEIARLKGQKAKPKIKPSNLEKGTKPSSKKLKTKPKKKSKSKTLVVHEEQNLHPLNLPKGSTFIDYKDYLVQDLIFTNWNIKYRRGRWKTPSGKYITAELPQNVTGHFGPDLQAFVLYQHYGCHVTQPLILEQLNEISVDISKGKINNIIIHGKSEFHDEKDRILTTGLSLSGYINVDDTGARHNGKNGYCTHIGNEYFAWFKSTESKSRINFLKLLRAGYEDFVINEDALEYMQTHKLLAGV